MSTLVLIIALITIFLTVFSLIKIPKHYFFKNYFILFTSITSTWLMANFIQIRLHSFFWLRTSYAFGALMVSSAMIMTITFSQQRKLSLRISSAIYLSGFAFFFLNYIRNAFFRENLLTPENFNNLTGVFTPLFTLYNLYLFGALLFMILKMFSCSKRFKGVNKKQAQAILYGIMLMGIWSFLFSFLLPLLGIPQYINLDVCGTLFFVTAISYAIFRYQLMNISIIVRRSTLYAVLVTFITGIYLTSILLFEYLFQHLIGYRYNSIFARLAAAVVIAFTFLPLRNRAEHFIDRTFFHTTYQYAQALIRFSETLLTILELRDLMGSIIANVSQILQVDHAALILNDKKNNDYRVKAMHGLESDIRDIAFSKSDPLVAWLQSRLHEHDQIAIRSSFGDEHPQAEETLRTQMDRLKAELCIPLFFQDQLIAILAIGNKKSGERYSSEDLHLLRTLANHAAVALANSVSFDDLKKSYLGTIEALAKAIEAKDEYTRGHSERVVQLSIEIAKEMNLTRDEINVLRFAGTLHDIGKIAVSDEILKKTSSLNSQEHLMMMKHPVAGENIIASIDFLQEVRIIIRHHHERWDGMGYPSGLRSESIPILSRILSIADSFDAMTSARSYRPALPLQTAIDELKRNAGLQFDPQIVNHFLSAHSKGNIH